MSWSQLGTLAAAGNEIGGKTVDGISLTTLTTAQQITEICNDRQSILAHGLKPSSFAYPGGGVQHHDPDGGPELRLRQRPDRGQPVPDRAHLRGDAAARRPGWRCAPTPPPARSAWPTCEALVTGAAAAAAAGCPS